MVMRWYEMNSVGSSTISPLDPSQISVRRGRDDGSTRYYPAPPIGSTRYISQVTRIHTGDFGGYPPGPRAHTTPYTHTVPRGIECGTQVISDGVRINISD